MPPGTGKGTDIVGDVRVESVTWSGADLITVEADPGRPSYPTGPQWLDLNKNGIIEEDVTGERALPVAYPRDTDAYVSATFTSKTTHIEYDLPPGILMVKARNLLSAAQPYFNSVPTTIVDNTLSLPQTKIVNPFPGSVNFGTLELVWEFSNNGGQSWTDVGTSKNELYVTLAAPVTAPVYHTPIFLSIAVSAVVAAAIESIVIREAWYQLQTKLIKTKNMTPSFSGRRLTYYEQWDTTSDNVGPLLASRDGKCGAFAELFINALKVAGVEFTPIEPFQVASDGNFENMLINSWPFVGVGAVNIILNFRIYNYSNTLSNPAINPDTTDGGVGSFTRKNQDGEWEYYWGANVEVDELIGLPGQNTENPKSHFSDHWLVKISGKYYDPSYGSKFDSLLDWENASVGGFSRTFHHNPFNHSIILRKNPEGLDVKTLPAGM